MLRALDRVEPWAAWGLVVGAVVVFVGVLVDVIRTGDAKWATLLVAADLIVSGYGELQDAVDDD